MLLTLCCLWALQSSTAFVVPNALRGGRTVSSQLQTAPQAASRNGQGMSMVWETFQSNFQNLMSSWSTKAAPPIPDAFSPTSAAGQGVFDVAVVGAGPGGAVMVSLCLTHGFDYSLQKLWARLYAVCEQVLL